MATARGRVASGQVKVDAGVGARAATRGVRARTRSTRISWQRMLKFGYSFAAVGLIGLVGLFVVGLFLYGGESAKPKPTPNWGSIYATPTPDRSRIVPKVYEPEDLAQLIASGNAYIVDARPTNDYLEQHIPGVQSMPHYHLAGQAASLPRDKPLITICNAALCKNGDEVARLAIEKGLDDVGYLKGGFEAWVARGLPTER